MAEKDDGDPWDFLGASKSKTSSESAVPETAPVSHTGDPESAGSEPSTKESMSNLMPTQKSPAKNEASDDDAWGFLATRKAAVAAREDEGGVPVARVERREAGEFRADMGGVSLKRRAWPMALAVALIALAGFLTDAVAASQVISTAGPKALLIIYPLGGIGLIIAGVLQFKFVDAAARLKVLRITTLIYAVVFIVGLVFLNASIIPIITIAVIWLLADQLNYLIPLLIWSLAGDEFNVAEGRKIFGWIVAWTYGGQVLGMLLAAVSAPILDNLGVGLTTILVIDPIICILVGVWLPYRMRRGNASQGLVRKESLKESFSSAREFINGVPVWRSLLLGSIVTFIAGETALIAFMSGESEIIGSNATTLQVFYASVMLLSFLVCWGLQAFAAQRLQDRFGIPTMLLVLPVATVLSGVILAIGIGTNSLVLLGIGLGLWFIPRWSVDENARRAALALVPDERRTRVSFVLDLFPISIGLILSGPIAAVGIFLGWLWVVPALAGLIAVCAIPLLLNVRRGWEDSLLNWRLRRRKQNRSSALGVDTSSDSSPSRRITMDSLLEELND